MNAPSISQCRLCGNSDLVSVLDLGTMALTGIFPSTTTEAVPDGPLELVKCHGDKDNVCGLVQLKHFFDPGILFGASYGYRSGLNASIRRHLLGIVRKARQFVDLAPGDVVLDVGSNDGTLLGFFSGQGFRLIGIDPTARQFGEHYPDEVCSIPALFSRGLVKRELGEEKVKVATAVAVFYDLSAPSQFMREMQELLSDDGILILEQSYLPKVIENNAYDTVCHEHAAYYGLKQLKWLADRTEFKIIDIELNAMNGGSFCVVLAKANSDYLEADCEVRNFIADEDRKALHSMAPYQVLREKVFQHREALRQTVTQCNSDGQQVAGYGASTKGNVLLQFCGLTPKEIPFIVDINKDKWGRVCPGSRIPIVSEQDAFAQRPDIYLVLPWHLREEFLVKERTYLQDGGAFLFPLPKLDVVRYS